MPSSHRISPAPAPNPLSNHLLAVLPAPVLERLRPYLELIPLPLGEALYESGGRLEYVYFPIESKEFLRLLPNEVAE